VGKWQVFADALKEWPTTLRLFLLLTAQGLGVGVGYELARILVR
jgi:hypothetical protein